MNLETSSAIRSFLYIFLIIVTQNDVSLACSQFTYTSIRLGDVMALSVIYLCIYSRAGTLEIINAYYINQGMLDQLTIFQHWFR